MEKYDRNGYKLRTRILVVTDKVNLLGIWQRVLGLGFNSLVFIIAKDWISLFSFRLYLLGFHYLFRIFSIFAFLFTWKNSPCSKVKLLTCKPSFLIWNISYCYCPDGMGWCIYILSVRQVCSYWISFLLFLFHRPFIFWKIRATNSSTELNLEVWLVKKNEIVIPYFSQLNSGCLENLLILSMW